jgi:predicted transposase/invertase (TIGR01784 family)
MANHDNGYKLLFSQAPMVADLLRGFVREQWVEKLDFSTLEKVDASYVSEDLKSREGDLVWRLRYGDGDRWLYVYLLLEFQSTVEPFMALRMLTYLGLFYQDCIRQGWLTPSGKLPPVLPLVLYNGKRKWSAAQEVAELIEIVPGGLERYQPHMRYALVDEGALRESDLASLRNLVAALIRLEKSRGMDDVREVLAALLQWLEEIDDPELRRAWSIWLSRVFLEAQPPGVEIRELSDFQEVKVMLAERVKEWFQEAQQEGFEQGIQRGREEGIQRGREEGRDEGVEQSVAALRVVTFQKLAERFGFPPSETTRRKVEALTSVTDLAELIARIPLASSLTEIGLE